LSVVCGIGEFITTDYGQLTKDSLKLCFDVVAGAGLAVWTGGEDFEFVVGGIDDLVLERLVPGIDGKR
jgi:hypothetical protein